ncbi:MAG: SpoIIE family protein phosphatase, partial [Clostridia bacterium]
MSTNTTEIGFVSLNKKDEQLCGDRVEIRQSEIGDGSITLVLADGLGSGVKANILSTLTSKIIATMMANGMSVEDCVKTMACTLPVCNQRHVAYSTFTIIKTTPDDKVIIIQYDNPDVIFIRNGKHVDYEKTEITIENKKIYTSEIAAKPDDVFIAMSDGAIYAGVGQTLNFGWQRDDIINYLEKRRINTFSAKGVALLLADECNELYNKLPGDDTTIATVKIRPRKTYN